MSELLTSKQLAKALGISESSLKRWCDAGRVPTIRTAGGHRRVRREDVTRLVRSGDLSLQHPEALGLPAASGKGDWTLTRGRDVAHAALLDGKFETVRQIVCDLYLCGQSIAAICDVVLAGAMREVGEGWQQQNVDVYRERRATGVVARVIHHLSQLLPKPLPNAYLAMGGVGPEDPYSLPTMMVELVMQEQGWKAASLGGPLPFASLQQAVIDHQPRLFWLSVSLVEDQTAFVEAYNVFYEVAKNYSAIVVGGREMTSNIRDQIRYGAYCENLQKLSDFVAAIAPPATKAPRASDNWVVEKTIRWPSYLG